MRLNCQQGAVGSREILIVIALSTQLHLSFFNPKISDFWTKSLIWSSILWVESARKWRGWSTPIQFLPSTELTLHFSHNSLNQTRIRDSGRLHFPLRLRFRSFRADSTRFLAVSMWITRVFFSGKALMTRRRLIRGLPWIREMGLSRSPVFCNGLLRNYLSTKRYCVEVNCVWWLWCFGLSFLFNFGFLLVGLVKKYFHLKN